jgi:hypothetical protein
MAKIKYDTLIIELQKEGKPIASAKIGTTDVEQLLKSHNVTIGEILQDIIDAMETMETMENGIENEGSTQLSLFE